MHPEVCWLSISQVSARSYYYIRLFCLQSREHHLSCKVFSVLKDSGSTDESWGVMCTGNTALTGIPGETSTVSSSVFGWRGQKITVHKSLWPHLELCLYWALILENVVVMTDSFRNVKNLFVELKQLFYLEKKRKDKGGGSIRTFHLLPKSRCFKKNKR